MSKISKLFLENLSKAKEKSQQNLYEDMKWNRPRGKLNIKNILNIQNLYKFTFPLEYVELMKSYNGAKPQKNRFDLNDEKGRVFSSLLNWDTSMSDNIIKTNKWVKSNISPKYFAFAKDPFGNLICFDFTTSKNSPGIIIWEHETNNVKKVEKSFSLFIIKLY